ncbi:MAG: NAD-dependent succinate-semialdehyde dehydrogenase [Anaerolineae bacterium]
MPDYTFKQLIDGQWIDAQHGGTWDLINPATEEVIGVMPFGDDADAQAAIDAAAAAFPSWSKKTVYERADVLKRAAEWIRARVDELAILTTEECGKPLRESAAEWQTGANLYEWYAEEIKRHYGRVIPARKADRRIMVVHHPLGVVGTISAWNFPVYNVARSWAAALAAGCTVVGRPSEFTPRSTMLLAQALVAAGIPNGVINVINGDADRQGQVMLNDPRLRHISFTGSTRVGKLLMDGASKTVTRLSLELGGNAPVLIFPDVDVEAVAKQSVSAKIRNNGQVCIAPQRYYVHSSIAEEYLEHVTTFMKAVKVGSGLQSTSDAGPLINAKQRERVEQIVKATTAQGAEVLVGGSRPETHPRGYFYNPTVIAHVDPSMPIYREEIFGPVMPVVPFDDVDEVIHMANDTEYGLVAYASTNNLKLSTKLYEELEYGMIAINDWLPSTPEAPFGGMKVSGVGRVCGEEGLNEFLDPKSVYFGGLTP